MTIVKIEHSNSRQLMQANGKDEWKGFVIHAEVGENEDPMVAGKKLLARMEELHGLYRNGESVAFSAELVGQRVTSEPFRLNHEKSEEQISREQQIEGYYEIIRMASTKKMLELHRPGIARMNDVSLQNEFDNKLNTIQ